MPHRNARSIEMNPAVPARTRVVRSLCAGIATIVLVTLPALAQFQINGAVIVGGGGRSESPGHCLRLEATIAEPSAGTSSGGTFALTAGHAAQFDPGTRDILFDSGFEACQ
jgi:hypothetical protein